VLLPPVSLPSIDFQELFASSFMRYLCLLDCPTLGWLAPGRHAVASPAQEGQSYNFILIIDKEHNRHPTTPENARDWQTRGNIDELKDMYQDHEPRVRKILDMVEPDDCRLWSISMLPNLKTWVSNSGKVVLLGNAAHAMYPYLAQVRSYTLHNCFQKLWTWRGPRSHT
jgi:hypothetical protein